MEALAPHVSGIVAHLHGCAWIDRVRLNGFIGKTMRAALAKSDMVICLGERSHGP